MVRYNAIASRQMETAMTDPNRITLYYSPQTRATGTRVLLEELGAPYDLRVLNMKAGEQRQPAYLAINPLGKVPAIHHRNALVTEQVAITIYLADLFPQAGLTPALNDPLRGPYLRWIAYYGASFEPALIDKFMQREPAPITQSPYADYDIMLGALEAQLSKGPYLLGERMTGADVLWGVAFSWDHDVRHCAEKGRVRPLCRTHDLAARVPAHQRSGR
ncbi:glutathione S-transferase [Bradyrhizobium sp. GM5.1]